MTSSNLASKILTRSSKKNSIGIMSRTKFAPKDHTSILTHTMDITDPYEKFRKSETTHPVTLLQKTRSPRLMTRPLPPIQINEAASDDEDEENIHVLESSSLSDPRNPRNGNIQKDLSSKSDLLQFLATQTNSISKSLQQPLSQVLDRLEKNEEVQKRLFQQTLSLHADMDVLFSSHDSNLRDEAQILQKLSKQQTLFRAMMSSMHQQMLAMSQQMEVERAAARQAIQTIIQTQQEQDTKQKETREKLYEERVAMTGAHYELQSIREGLGDLKGDVKDQMKTVVDAIKELEKVFVQLRIDVQEQKRGLEMLNSENQRLEVSLHQAVRDVNAKLDQVNHYTKSLETSIHTQQLESTRRENEWKTHIDSLQSSWESRFHDLHSRMTQEHSSFSDSLVHQKQQLDHLIENKIPIVQSTIDSQANRLQNAIDSTRSRQDKDMKAILSVIQTLKSSLHLRREEEKSQSLALQTRLDSFVNTISNDIQDLRASLLQFAESGSRDTSRPTHPLIIM